MITVLLLNYKRKENIRKIVECLKKQTLDCEIFLWNNSNDIYKDDRIDWIVNSNKNQHCWPRWFMGDFASNKFVMSMDDDLIFNQDTALEKLYNEAIIFRKKGRAIGIEGVRIQNFSSYFSTKKQTRLNKLHIGKPNLHIIKPRTNKNVDIIKGRLLLCAKEDLKGVPLNIKYLLYGDDIAISYFLSNGKKEHHIVTNQLTNMTIDLPGSHGTMALNSHKDWDKIRIKIVKDYFGKSFTNSQ